MKSRRTNLTEGMLDVITSAIGSVEACGSEHEVLSGRTEEEKEEFWRNFDRLEAWIRQEYTKRSKYNG